MDHDGQAGLKSAAGLAFGRLKDLLHQEFGTHDRRFKGALSGMHGLCATLSGFEFGAF